MCEESKFLNIELIYEDKIKLNIYFQVFFFPLQITK